MMDSHALWFQRGAGTVFLAVRMGVFRSADAAPPGKTWRSGASRRSPTRATCACPRTIPYALHLSQPRARSEDGSLYGVTTLGGSWKARRPRGEGASHHDERVAPHQGPRADLLRVALGQVFGPRTAGRAGRSTRCPRAPRTPITSPAREPAQRGGLWSRCRGRPWPSWRPSSRPPARPRCHHSSVPASSGSPAVARSWPKWARGCAAGRAAVLDRVPVERFSEEENARPPGYWVAAGPARRPEVDGTCCTTCAHGQELDFTACGGRSPTSSCSSTLDAPWIDLPGIRRTPLSQYRGRGWREPIRQPHRMRNRYAAQWGTGRSRPWSSGGGDGGG